MSVFGEHRATVAGKLAAAGLAGVTTDPAALPPFVLVDLVTIDRPAGVGAWGGELPVKIVVPPPGDATAADALETALETVLSTLGFGLAAPGTYRGPADKEYPAYTVTYPVEISNPNC